MLRKNRGRKVLRCVQCHKKKRVKFAHGRTTGSCGVCGARLSQKLSATEKCRKCFLMNSTPWNKGLKGAQVAWNKGKSLFSSHEEYRAHFNNLRRRIRLSQSQIQKYPDRIRTLIRNSMRYNAGVRKNGTKTEFYLGCSITEFMRFIEKKFTPGMSWENYGNGYGKWNIDHILPISKFDLTVADQAKSAFHFSNCRPMWAIENVRKGNRILAATLTTTVTY